MITLYEQIQRARRGEVFFTHRAARNVTSAAGRVGRKVITTQYLATVLRGYKERSRNPIRVTRVKVIS